MNQIQFSDINGTDPIAIQSWSATNVLSLLNGLPAKAKQAFANGEIVHIEGSVYARNTSV